jgi:hypothetical protein
MTDTFPLDQLNLLLFEWYLLQCLNFDIPFHPVSGLQLC